MEQLVYISTPRTVLTETDLHQILEVSRRNNRRDGLTGLLLAGDKRLLQVLEGPTQALSDAFECSSLRGRCALAHAYQRTGIPGLVNGV
jgi:hypothetical protein